MKSVGARLVALLGKGRGTKRAKYGNQKVHTEAGVFDSKAEYRRWQDLQVLERDRQIWNLHRQVRIAPIATGGEKVGYYVADFIYCTQPYQPWDAEHRQFAEGAVVEDVKGHRTQLYIWKRKHLKAQYGIEISEVKA